MYTLGLPAEDISKGAGTLLSEYRQVSRSLQPILFFLATNLTVNLVLDLYYSTGASLQHLTRSLAYLHMLVINTALLCHLFLAAEDCYRAFKTILNLLR